MRCKKIGLAGKSGSGKDLIADMLCEKYGYRKIAVADGIREECLQFITEGLRFAGWGCFDLPHTFSVVIRAFEEAVWAKPTTPEMRILLQWWGTEYRRSQDQNYWIEQLSSRLRNDELMVVSDVRLTDEMAVVRAAGGEVWFVERPGVGNVGIAGHATEHGLDGATFDHYVMNAGTIEELELLVESAFVANADRIY